MYDDTSIHQSNSQTCAKDALRAATVYIFVAIVIASHANAPDAGVIPRPFRPVQSQNLLANTNI